MRPDGAESVKIFAVHAFFGTPVPAQGKLGSGAFLSWPGAVLRKKARSCALRGCLRQGGGEYPKGRGGPAQVRSADGGAGAGI